MIKKSLFILLALCMLWSVPASARQEVQVSGMTYTSSGQRVTSIPQGGVLEAQVTMTNETDGQQGGLFSMTLYQDGKIQGVNVDTKTLEAGEEYMFTVQLTMPEETAGCLVRTVLWDSFENMKVLYSGSIFPSGETGLKKLYIDGNLVESSATTEINVEIPFDQKYAPVVEALPLDGAASLSIQSPTRFMEKSVITAVAADGTEETYTINYKLPDDEPRKAAENLHFIAEGLPAAQIKEWDQIGRLAFGENVSNGSKVYADRAENISYGNLADELKGCTAIQTSLDWVNGQLNETIQMFSKNTAAVPWISFDINRNTTVKVLSAVELPSFKQGEWNTGDPTTGWTMRKAPTYFAQRLLNGALNANLPYIYEKTFTVEDSPVTVVIPNACTGGFPYTVLLDFPYETK
jgi:hypothetical protein